MDSPTPTLTGGKLSEPEYSGSSSSVLNDKIEESRLNLAAQHPSLQRRGLLGNDNYDDDDNGGQHYKVQSTNVSKILERNLDEMSGSLARLKGLAIGLSEEIDSQNDLIENVMTKTDKADIMLERQNKDMRHLLKK